MLSRRLVLCESSSFGDDKDALAGTLETVESNVGWSSGFVYESLLANLVTSGVYEVWQPSLSSS